MSKKQEKQIAQLETLIQVQGSMLKVFNTKVKHLQKTLYQDRAIISAAVHTAIIGVEIFQDKYQLESF